MRCSKTISYLNAYADSELSRRRCRVVEAHLAACESCRGQIEEIRGIDKLFMDSLPVPPVPDGFALRIMAEARRRQMTGISGRRSQPLTWTHLKWVTGFSVSMRIATCATVLLAILTGLTLDGTNVTRRNVLIEQGKNIYGLEWFAPVPPGSIGSIYIAMADQSYERGNGQ